MDNHHGPFIKLSFKAFVIKIWSLNSKTLFLHWHLYVFTIHTAKTIQISIKQYLPQVLRLRDLFLITANNCHKEFDICAWLSVVSLNLIFLGWFECAAHIRLTQNLTNSLTLTHSWKKLSDSHGFCQIIFKRNNAKKSFECESETTVIYQIIFSGLRLALKLRLLSSVFVNKLVLVQKQVSVNCMLNETCYCIESNDMIK